VRAGEESGAGAKVALCQQAAASYLALVAARVLRRPHPQLEAMEADFEKLPAHVEWVLTQLTDAAQSFAAQLRGLRGLCAVGGGFYHPAALQWAWLVRKLTGIDARGFEVAEFLHGPLARLEREAAVIVVSGSRCRAKKYIHQLVERLRKAKLRIFSVSDANDPEVSRHSELAVLLPVLSEVAGATLALAVLDWVAYQAARGQEPGLRPASLHS
jgi:glucosamine 6-phosphate synthetase-like amidotransferase/phosphosugar isomerase protein